MSISKVSIFNNALTQIGAAPIVSFDDDSQNARVGSRVYEDARRSALSECCWNFAVTRATLSLSVVTMPWSYPNESYVYVRPADAVRIFEVSDPYAQWREEGDYIISDTANLGIKYVYDLDNPDKYTPSFIAALTDLLSAGACFTILNSATKADAFQVTYEKLSLPKAKSMNAQTGTQQTPRDSAWENSKYSNGSPDA